jgi:hypothetical protein
MSTPLFNRTMNDGSRHFAALPESRSWEALRDHFSGFDGAEVTAFVSDGITEVWIDFTYRGHRFSVNNQYGEYWFFVADPRCADEILREVVKHAEEFLGGA